MSLRRLADLALGSSIFAMLSALLYGMRMLSLVPSNRPSRARFRLLPRGGKSMSSNSQGFSEVHKIEQLLKPLKATVIFLKVRTRPSVGV